MLTIRLEVMAKKSDLHETFATGMPLQQLAKLCREQGEKLFRRRHPYPFLFLRDGDHIVLWRYEFTYHHTGSILQLLKTMG